MDESPVSMSIDYTPDGRCILRATWPEQSPEERPRFTYLGPMACLPALMQALADEVSKHFGRPPLRHGYYCAYRIL